MTWYLLFCLICSRSFGGMPIAAAAAGAGPVTGQQGFPPVPFGGFPKLNPGPLAADGMLQIVPQQQSLAQPPVIGGAGMTFDMPTFESIHVDPFHLDYSNQILQSTESPNFGFDYAQQVLATCNRRSEIQWTDYKTYRHFEVDRNLVSE